MAKKNHLVRVKILDQVPMDLLSEEQFIRKTISWVVNKEKRKVFYINAHSVLTAINNSNFLTAINLGNLVYPDGWGPVIVARMEGFKNIVRINAADFIDDLLQKLNDLKVKIYLLGSEKSVLEKTVQKIQKKYSKIIICGYHQGFFNKEKERLIIKEIKSTKPHIVLVGMGVPKQELWVNDNWDNLPNAVYWTVGGLFYYISGLRSRAPKWMRNYSFEWLYRLIQEPKRLWERYTFGNLLFIYYFFSWLIKKKISHAYK